MSAVLGYLAQCAVCPQQALLAEQPDGWICPRCVDLVDEKISETDRSTTVFTHYPWGDPIPEQELPYKPPSNCIEERECSNCGDQVLLLSSRDWCDGCETEADQLGQVQG